MKGMDESTNSALHASAYQKDCGVGIKKTVGPVVFDERWIGFLLGRSYSISDGSATSVSGRNEIHRQ
jgi:hypothetical protein